MSSKSLLSALLLAFAACNLGAQNIPVSVPDGPVVETDSLKAKPVPFPMAAFPFAQAVRMPEFLFPGENAMFETKEQRAAKINELTRSLVMLSLNQVLYWCKMPEYTPEMSYAMYAGSFFLTDQYAFPRGCVPLMNHSFQFIYAKTPGMAPYEQMYSPELFPQCIKSEFDISTGTYKQVMVDWSEFQKNMKIASEFKGSFNTAPVPKIAVTPVEKAMAR